MFSVLKWELTRRRKSIFWWSLASAVLCAGILSLYPSIRDQANQLNQVINQLPPGLRELKTGGANNINVADPVQFINSQILYVTLPIVWIILAITRGGRTLGREEQSHTLELLLARPISRLQLLAGKAAELVIELLAVGAVALITLLLLAPSFDMRLSSGYLALATLYTAAFSLSFGLIAFALQAASQATARFAGALAVVIGFGGYLLTSLSGLTDWLKTPAKFAPYHYFAPDKILLGHVATGLNWYLAGVVVIGSGISYWGFRRRDIA